MSSLIAHPFFLYESPRGPFIDVVDCVITKENIMGQVRIADLPSSTNIDKDSYMVVERPGVGDGTFKTTLGDIQEAITVRAKVIREGYTTTIVVKDITGETEVALQIPTAKVVENGDNTITLTLTDTDGSTSSTVVSRVEVDAEPTQGSPNFVTSGTVYNIVDEQQHDESRITSAEQRITVLEQRFTDLQNQFNALRDDVVSRLEATEETVARSITVEQHQTVDDPFSIGGERYETLEDAITASIQSGKPIKLFSDATSKGIAVAEGSEFTLDLNGYTLDMTGPGSGSPGTKTLGMQLLKDSTVTIKNGTLIFDDDRLRMGIQNYCNLTLDNVNISGGPTILYVVSNNYGNVTFKNGTTITASEGRVAFDAWYGMAAVYDDPGVFVTIADDSVQINGIVEFGKAERASYTDFKNKASITTPIEFYLNLSLLTVPCEWLDNGDGTKTLRYVGL